MTTAKLESSLNFRVSKAVREQLDTLAAEQSRKIGDYCRLVLEQHCELVQKQREQQAEHYR